MKRLPSLVVSSLVALSSSLALAEEPAQAAPAAPAPTAVQVSAKAVLEKELLTPLAVKERKHSRLSRSRLPPLARRARIVDSAAHTDARGEAFVAFAVDDQHGYVAFDDGPSEASWRKDVIVGCVYPERGEVFVRIGNDYRPGSLLLGKSVKVADASVCHDGNAPLANAVR